MTTRALAITKRQAVSLLKAAAEERGVIEIDTPLGTVRLIPEALAPKPKPVDDEPKGYF